METTLSGRMKEYEEITNYKLIKKTPVIIRLDGKNFSSFTKGLDKPFDEDFDQAMKYTCLVLKEKMDNVRFIYSHSDEISILLTDWNKEKEQDGGRVDCYYDYRLQKIVSVATSIATTAFNKYIELIIEKYKDSVVNDYDNSEEDRNKVAVWLSKKYKANFDGRAFNIPIDEVNNYFIYRQKDCYRNAVSNFAITLFSHKELQHKSIEERVDMLKEKGVDFNQLPINQTSGFCLYPTIDDKTGRKVLRLYKDDTPDFCKNTEFITQLL